MPRIELDDFRQRFHTTPMSASRSAVAARLSEPSPALSSLVSPIVDLAQFLKRVGFMSTTNGRHPDPTLSSLHVLVVDDEFLIRWSLAETLAEEGHRLAEAGDAETALKMLGSDEPFDVVLLDYHLPDSHDLTLLANIRRLAPRAVVIMMTAFGTAEMFEHALELGAFQVVPKPFDVHDIASLVQQAHASRHADALH